MDRLDSGEGQSDGADRRRLRPAIALLDVEFDPLPLLEAAVAIHLDGGEVHEHIPTTVDRDEAVALVRVEPLDGALSHYPTTPSLRSGLSGPAPCYRGTRRSRSVRRARQAGIAVLADRERPDTTLPPVTLSRDRLLA